MKTFKDWFNEGHDDDHYLGSWSTDPEHVMSGVPGPLQRKVGPTDPTGIYHRGGIGPADTGMYVPSPNAKTAITPGPGSSSTRNLQGVFQRIQSLEQHLERLESMIMTHMNKLTQGQQVQRQS